MEDTSHGADFKIPEYISEQRKIEASLIDSSDPRKEHLTRTEKRVTFCDEELKIERISEGRSNSESSSNSEDCDEGFQM